MSLFNIVASLALDSSDYDRGLTDSESKGKKFASLLSGGLATGVAVAGAAIAAAGAATVKFGTDAVKTGLQFDSAMSQVAATMGLTTDQIENLRDFALDMGSKTAFSATQAAQALNYMALAGYDAETSMKMLPNVLNLAAAGGMDLAAASDMITDAQSALGLSLDDTTEMVDKMAIAASKSNTSVAQLGEAILTVGGTAKNLKGGTTELATVLGILADNGIKGAEGGTALRNIITSLSAPTGKAGALMESLGISMYDAQGNMRSLNDVFLDLNAVMDGMTQQDRATIISTLFNKRDMKSAEALLANVGGRFNQLSGYLDAVGAKTDTVQKMSDALGAVSADAELLGDAMGAAGKMAGTQLDNLQGDITLFQSALEGAKITVSDKLTPTLREFTKFGGEAVSGLADAFKKGGLEGAFAKLGDILSQAAKKFIDLAPKLMTAGISFLKSILKGITDNLPMVADTALMLVEQLATALGEDILPVLIPSVIEAILLVAEKIVEHLPTILQAALTIVTGVAEGLLQSVPTILEMLPVLISGIVSFLYQSKAMIEEAGVQLLSALMDNLPAILDAYAHVLPTLIKGIVLALMEHFPEMTQAGTDLLMALVEVIPTIISAFVLAIPEFFDAVAQSFNDALPAIKELAYENSDKIVQIFLDTVNNAKQWGKDLLENFIDGIKSKFDKLKGTVKSAAQTVKDFLGFSEPKKGPLSDFHEYAPDMIDLFVKGIKDNVPKLNEAFKEVLLPEQASPIVGSRDVAGLTGGRNTGTTTINVYAAKMSPSEVFNETRLQMERMELASV